MNKVNSSKKDYMYALEGISYAQILVNSYSKKLEENMNLLRKQGVLSGDTGEEYIKKLSMCVDTVNGVKDKFNILAGKVAEICNKNEAHLANDFMADFDKASKMFDAKAQEIRTKKISAAQ